MLNRFRWFGSIPVWVADFVVGHPFWVLAILVALTGASGYSARNLRFDFNPEAVFSSDNPTVKYAKEFNRDFGDDETVIIIGFEATGDANVVTSAALTWQAETVHAFEKIEHVVRVESLISMETPHVTFSLPPKISYEPIISETPVSADTAEVLRDRLAQTEMPFGSLVSKDYKMAAELVVFDATQQGFDAMQAMVKNVDETLAKFPVPNGYRTVVSGLPVLRVGIVRDLGKDQTRLMPLAGILYLITLALVFRSVSGSTLPLIAVGQGLIWTFGVMAFWGQPLNIVSNILPCMLLINGVSNSIHVLTRYSEEAVHPGTTRRDASRRTIRQMLVACLGAFATAALGFFVLRTASSPVLQEFGTQAAMGLSFLYVTVILTLGALLPFFKAPAFQDSRLWMAFSRGLAGIVNRLIHWKWATVGVFVAVALLALWRARSVEINSSALETYDEDNPAIQNLRLLENRLSGLMPLEISLKANNSDLFYQPDIYRKVAELQRFAMQQSPVLFSRSYLDYFNEINRPFSKAAETPGKSDNQSIDDREIERGRLFLNRVADEMRYWEFMTHDHRRTRLLLKLRDVGTRDTLALVATLKAKMAELFPPGSGIDPEVTGDAYVDAAGLTEMIHELLTSILTAALVIFGLIAILFRSLRIGLITIPPNVIPLVVTFGYMGLRGFELNAGNVIVFTISLGIAVDNTIHYILRFREEFAKDPDMGRATWKTMLGKGQPMCMATFLTVIGLAVLLLSDFVPTRRFAELTIVTLTGALFGALFLLPACVAILWKRPRAVSPQASQLNLEPAARRLPS
jgi:uncharacterized protein